MRGSGIMTRRAVVIGGSGSLGRTLLPALSEHYEVVNFDARPAGHDFAIFARGDAHKLEDVAKATRGADAIIYAGAAPMYVSGEAVPAPSLVEVGDIINVFEAARINEVNNIVLTSSICVLGAVFKRNGFVPPYLPLDEAVTPSPDEPYGLGRSWGEQLGRAYNGRYGIRCIALRLATVHFADSIWREARAHVADSVYELPGLGLNLRDFLWQYVDPMDLPDAYLLALEAMESGKVTCDVFNIGAADVFSTVQTVELLARYFPGIPVVEEGKGFIAHPYGPVFDISKARKVLGYSPKFTWRNPSD